MGLALEYLERNREYLTHSEKSRIHTMIKTGRHEEAMDRITSISNERRRMINEQGRKAGKGKSYPGI